MDRNNNTNTNRNNKTEGKFLSSSNTNEVNKNNTEEKNDTEINTTPTVSEIPQFSGLPISDELHQEIIKNPTSKKIESKSNFNTNNTEENTTHEPKVVSKPSSTEIHDNNESDPAAKLRAFAAMTLRNTNSKVTTDSNAETKIKSSPIESKKVVLPSIPITENYEPVLSLLDKTVNNMVQNMENKSITTSELSQHPLLHTELREKKLTK